ncbi:uncharacterized protein LOC131235189 [Magnolia sinica]|uniref:uncharacterized protein LOC131235189 n=1 Tax=Magnolia sinica TaxID=86752 RepID=UPI0026589D2C|nr:uncharacterized protein LOC131235189 [Magnolia sinica]
MASSPFNRLQNLVSSQSPFASSKIRGRSTAQMRLEKILEIISSHPHCFSSKASSAPTNQRFQNSGSETDGPKQAVRDFVTGFEIDLNLRLGSGPEILGADDLTAEEIGLSACSGVGGSDGCNSSPGSEEVSTVEKSCEGECDPKAMEKREEEEEAREVSEVTEGKLSHDSEKGENRVGAAENGEESDSNPIFSCREEEVEDRERKRQCGNDGYLGLLLEAVRQISGDFEDGPPIKEEPAPADGNQSLTGAETEPARCCRTKRKTCWMLDFYGGFEDTAPVVRSNRGRNQVLPYRFRDSVLEPWKRKR